MQYTYELDTRLADDFTIAPSKRTGRFVRNVAIVGWAVNAVFVITTLLVFPVAAQSLVAWAPFAMVAVLAGLTYRAGLQLQRR